MPSVTIDGIRTEYDVVGSGPPLLMFSPGGFDARLENWRTLGIYRRTDLMRQLSEHHTCIVFDRRESGGSGGRVERLAWAAYAAQGRGLLDHLDIDQAYLMGGCVGCSVVLAVAVAHPQRVRGMVLYSPAGGPRYRITQHARFAQHLSQVQRHGTAGVVELARGSDASFAQEPRLGPWAGVIRADPDFAAAFAQLDADRYRLLVRASARLLFDRDTVPGAEPEELLQLDVPALVVPGQDTSHATSAARYLQECLAGCDYWDVPVSEQTADTAPQRVLGFLSSAERSPG